MQAQGTYRSQKIKQHAHNFARVLKVSTPHGEFLTPAFMPVGTYAVVNTMTPQDLTATGSQIILGGNTYHMLSQPGMQVIEALGGMHQMMQWFGPMLTDSGGYQVFSLSQNSKICKINEEGAKFKHPQTGKYILMTPQTSIETQKIIGADI
ncbi:MAG: tRNA-guanine transglycosylase, partial [Gammaproteobacteria bacterium]|nr:tRNA-guanine transglycosylase [Gammaproteobacteria bacterium]